jgi:hypothetical protein
LYKFCISNEISRVRQSELTIKSDALFTTWLVNNAFQKEWFGKFGFKIDEILKKSSPENEKSTKCCI